MSEQVAIEIVEAPAVSVEVVEEGGVEVVEIIHPGPQGIAGFGSEWLAGAGAPTSQIGSQGDFYIDTTTGNVFGPRGATTWGSAIYNIAEGQQGPAGAPGAPGPKGDTGDPGAAGSAGVVAATAPITYNAGTQTVGISAATTSAAGTMSAADKAKLDGIAAGAQVNVGVPAFIQATQPTSGQLAGSTQYAWWDTSNNDLTLWIEDGL